MDIPGTFNSMVYATVQPTTMENLQNNFDNLLMREDVHPVLLSAMYRILENQRPTVAGEVLFTDDRAPVEWIINDMVVRFVLGGEYEELQ